MKTTNVILGIAAVLCAIGSALASVNSPLPNYIDVKYQNEAFFTCTTLNVCGANGSIPCSAIIQGFTAPVYDIRLSPEQTCDVLVTSDRVTQAGSKPKVIVAVR